MDQFPPLEQSRAKQREQGVFSKLKEMFPAVEELVIEMILEETHGEFNSAADILLSMSGDDQADTFHQQRESDAVSPLVPLNPFHLAAEALLSTDEHAPSREKLPSPPNLVNPAPTGPDAPSTVSTPSLHEEDAIRQSDQTADQGRSILQSPAINSKPEANCIETEKLERKFEQLELTEATSRFHFKEGDPGVLKSFEAGHKVMLILRGPPGCGKTTLANKYVRFLQTGCVYSSDDYFLKNGRYVFNPYELSGAHEYNQRRVGAALGRGDRLVIVDNTNTMSWEIRPYITMAAENGYVVHIQQPDTPWFFNAKELARRNTHSVPKQKIEIMLGRYEKNVTVADLMTRYNIEVKNDPVGPKPDDIDDSCDIFQSDDEEEEEEEEEEGQEEDPTLHALRQPTCDIDPSVQGAEREPDASNQQQKLLNNDAYSIEPEIGLGWESNVQLENASAASWDVSSQQSWSEEPEDRSWNGDSSDPVTVEEPKPVRQPRPSRARNQQLDISSPVFEPRNQYHYDSTASDDPSASSHLQGPDARPEPTMSLSMDPMFAVQLQEAFGPPLEDSLLQFLNTNEVLTANIPYSLAHQFFNCWQDSLRECLGAKPDNTNEPPPAPEEKGIPVTNFTSESEHESPKTVLAPNAVEYYEKKLLEKVLKESSDLALNAKKRPLIVVKSQSADRLHQCHNEESEDDLEVYRHQRNLLYRKAMEARASKIGGAAAYYSAEAREMNKQFKTKQYERQIGMFRAANDSISQNKLDLHFLTTADAIKQLQMFIETRIGSLRNDETSVEIVTGKGNRSENGRSRLRPAVINWLQQKNYRYSEINSGALRVYLKPG